MQRRTWNLGGGDDEPREQAEHARKNAPHGLGHLRIREDLPRQQTLINTCVRYKYLPDCLCVKNERTTRTLLRA